MLAGVGIGVLARYKVETVRQMECVTNDTMLQLIFLNKLKGEIQIMHQSELSMSHLLKIEATIIELSVFTEIFFFGLSLLIDGKLSLDVVKSEVARREFHSMQSAASDKGYERVTGICQNWN